jgi:hypothetical protein
LQANRKTRQHGENSQAAAPDLANRTPAGTRKWPLAIAPWLKTLAVMESIKDDQPSIKKAAICLVQNLPESASWDDLMHEVFVRQKIESGLEDLQAGRTHTHDSVRQEFGVK